MVDTESQSAVAGDSVYRDFRAVARYRGLRFFGL